MLQCYNVAALEQWSVMLQCNIIRTMIGSLFQLPWRDNNLEAQIDLSMGIVRIIRSIRQEYMLNKTKADGKCFTLIWFNSSQQQ